MCHDELGGGIPNLFFSWTLFLNVLPNMLSVNSSIIIIIIMGLWLVADS
jgi:hypothetical protein